MFSVGLADGAATPLTPESGFVRASAATRDGSVIAVTAETNGVRQAARLDRASGRLSPLKPDGWEQSSADISPDARWLIFSSNVDGRETLFADDLRSGSVRALPLPPGVNAEINGSHSGFSPDSAKLIVSHQSGNEPADLWLVDLKAWTAAPLHALGSSPLSPDRLPPSRLVHYRSDDGTTISAFLWLPFNLKRDGHAPGIVYPHGGPTGQTLDRFDRTALALASRGYVVIAPNPRGSTGYGRAFQEANFKDLGGGDLKDEIAAKRFLVATGYVDAKRVGITGGSYGGYMTLMAVSKTPNEWAAGVEQYGIIDWKHMYETEAPTLQAYQRGLMGEPDGEGGVYARQSPMTYIHQTRAPLLVLQGDNDIRVPEEPGRAGGRHPESRRPHRRRPLLPRRGPRLQQAREPDRRPHKAGGLVRQIPEVAASQEVVLSSRTARQARRSGTANASFVILRTARSAEPEGARRCTAVRSSPTFWRAVLAETSTSA